MPFRSFFLRSAISHRISGFTLSHLSGINSWSWGLFGIFVSTSLSHAHGSTKLFLQLAISDVSTAARCPACSLPTNNQFLRPMAIGRIARSAKLCFHRANFCFARHRYPNAAQIQNQPSLNIRVMPEKTSGVRGQSP